MDAVFAAGKKRPAPSCRPLRWAIRNLVLFLAIGVLCIANVLLHEPYPIVVAWLPSGLALGAVLLMGPRLIPAVVAGTALGVLAAGVDLKAATLFGIASGGASAVTWGLLQVGKPVDFTRQTVAAVGRLLITACLVYGSAAFLMGPYAISQLIKHHHKPLTHVAEMAMAIPEPASNIHADAQHRHAGGQVEGQVAIQAAAHAPTPVHTGSPQSLSKSSAGHPHAGNKDLLEWLLIDAIGVLLVTPIIAYLSNCKGEPLREMRERWAGASAVLAVLIGVSSAIYSGYLEDNFGIVHTTLLVLPPAVWLALEYGLGYTLIGNLAVFLITGVGTSFGHGPFKDHSAGLPLLTVVISLTTLLIAASRSERRAAEQTIHRLATHDTLTGVANRSEFGKRMEQALYGARRYTRRIALMFIDLNRFKQVNDTLGHEVGDLLLIEVTKRIHACIRSDSVLARFGGDEFVVLIDHVDSRETLGIVAQRIAESVSAPFKILGHECHVTCSVGISIYPDHGASMAELVRNADAAMYQVKGSGSNGFRFYSDECRAGSLLARRQYGELR